METTIFNLTKPKHVSFFNFPEPELIFKETHGLVDPISTYELSNNFLAVLEQPELSFDEDYFISVAQQ